MTSEDNYYARKCAALDPKCHQYIRSSSFNLTVPPGEEWGILNAWFLNNPSLNSVGQKTAWFHRELDVDSVHWASSGTVLQPISGYSDSGVLAYCRPFLANVGVDPKGLYYDRLDMLASLPIRWMGLKIPSGSPHGVYVGEDFHWDDSSQQFGILRHVSMQGGAWSIVVGGTPNGHPMTMANTDSEIDDHHFRTHATKLVWPFPRYDQVSKEGWTGFWLMTGNLLGNNVDPANQDEFLVVQWSVLPPEWWIS